LGRRTGAHREVLGRRTGAHREDCSIFFLILSI
jgi:hypothetical protein